MGPVKFLLDTGILVDYLRGYQSAVSYLKDKAKHCSVSVITVAELYAGLRDKKEGEVVDELLRLFPVLPVDANIARLGGTYKRDYFKSHGVGLADALLAATADTHDAALQTLNIKHFPMFPGIKAPY